MIKSILNWSGGKDSALALYHIVKERDYSIESLVTTVNRDQNRISMHGVKRTLLEKQAVSIGLPLRQVLVSEMPSMDEYEKEMRSMLMEFKTEGITHSIFGDIFLEDLRKYRDQKLSGVDIIGHYPLWEIDTYKLFNDFVTLGFKAVIVCTNAKYLDDSYLGRVLDHDLLNEFPADVDPCGENGEYHTFVFDGPIFEKPIEFTAGEKLFKTYKTQESGNHDSGFWYLDLND